MSGGFAHYFSGVLVTMLRAKGTLISDPRFSKPLQHATFATQHREITVMQQEVEYRGSLISVPFKS